MPEQTISWNLKQEQPNEPQTFTNKDVEQWLKPQKETQHSNVCVVLYGQDGVGKSGAAIDCYTEEDIKNNKKIVIFDLDGSAGPIVHKYHEKNGHNILLFDPTVLTPQGDIDYVTSYNKILAVTKYLVEKEDELNLKAVVFDGLDTLLKICEYVMRYEDLKIDPDVQIKDAFNWSKRNRRYLTIVLLLKHLKCDKYFTTHMKDVQIWKRGPEPGLEKIGEKPDWEKSTPGIMFQKVFLKRIQVDNQTSFEAIVEKAKGALDLEGSIHKVAEKTNDGFRWYGLKTLFDRFRT
jgi:hypothetical protein